MKRRWGIAITLLIGGQLLTSCSILPKEEEFKDAPMVKEYEGVSYGKVGVLRGDLRETEEVSGNYEGTETISILGAGDMPVKKVYVKKGSKVESGDLLIRYEVESYEKKAEAARLQIKKFNLDIKQKREIMKLEVEKQKRLGADKQTIQGIKKQYEDTISSIQTEIKLATLDLEGATSGIEDYDVVSEIDGVVTEVFANLEGSLPDAETTIIKIRGKKKNRFRIDSEYANRYKEGDIIYVSVKGTEYETKVVKTKNKKRFYLYPLDTSIAFIENARGSFDCILSEKKDVLYLPAAAVFEMGDKHVVYVEDEKGLKTMKEVQIGVTIDHLTEIVSGLEENEQVITS